jgi:hypothetical protein
MLKLSKKMLGNLKLSKIVINKVKVDHPENFNFYTKKAMRSWFNHKINNLKKKELNHLEIKIKSRVLIQPLIN